MEDSTDLQEQERDCGVQEEEIIVRADEMDETGTNISTILPEDGGDFEARVEARREQDIQSIGSPKELANSVSNLPEPPVRPILRREGSAPPPPRQPPPPAPPSQEDAPVMADSLSLAELRNMVRDFPKSEAAAYAYEYEDTRTFPEELEEWFQYTREDNDFVIRAKKAFEDSFLEFLEKDRITSAAQATRWLGLRPGIRGSFLDHQVRGLDTLATPRVMRNLDSIAHIAMGMWQETTWLDGEPSEDEQASFRPPNDKYQRTFSQLEHIRSAAEFLSSRTGLLQALYDVMRSICDNDKAFGSSISLMVPITDDEMASMKATRDRQLNAVLTTLYFVVESGRKQIAKGAAGTIRQAIVALEPDLLHYLVKFIAKLRWDDSYKLPISRLLLIMWKSLLLTFGGSKELITSKEVLHSTSEGGEHDEKDFLTASPLDYHIFRQEITSKYPAYNPPPPLVPLELNNNSVLPPLPNHPSRSASQDSLHTSAGAQTNGIGKSIFHQPVHISTPAPSPPPSPAGPGGKGGKKQNYQTNQNFPFLYPPLDNTSNIVGDKGDAELQDRLVGKKWEGCDIPASILEAGQLFASRMRMSRSLRQLWDVREEFMKFERGWEDPKSKERALKEKLEEQLKELDLEDDDNEIEAGDERGDTESTATFNGSAKATELTKETDNVDVQRQLDAVDSFYRNSLPHLQSIVIVLLKLFLSNVTALSAQTNGQNGLPNPIEHPERQKGPCRPPKSNVNLAKQMNGLLNGNHSENETADSTIVELNLTRLREITSKAIAGILLIMLKWFKLSHILKFEYLTQLLLDSNFLPLALKFFAHQDVDMAVHQINNREDLDFFHLCRLHSGHPVSPSEPRPPSSNSSSEDEAQPPPISRTRRSPPRTSPPPSPGSSPSPPPPPGNPEVDELGAPTTDLPPSPLTTYAPRFFHVTTTTLRLLQKITKGHAHRALLLVQYKSSTILRRLLKIPQPSLRLYTLKLFKSQVPFCGRKWRQTNMRVITAIYLHVRPELRDEWISGGGIEEAVEEAVPLEQAGRSLVHWWHLKNYRDHMGVDADKKGIGALGEGEGDFFARELERMGWGIGGIVGVVGVETDEEEREEEARVGRGDLEGPLLGEGWYREGEGR
ncbi:Factor arrest protein 11 [Trapelia coarctata]|nr:Factor arrest protein 11 [Trapelia coarctata]